MFCLALLVTCIAMSIFCLQTDAKITNLLDHQKQLRSRREVLVRMIAADVRAPQVDYSGTFSWDSQALQQLSKFGLTRFR